MLEQMKEPLHNIAQDMYTYLNRSCEEEIVRSSLARARRSAPKKRRRVRRKSCQTGLQRHHRGKDFLNRRSCSQLQNSHHVQHLLPPSHHHLHSNNRTSHRTILHECGTVSWYVLNSLRLEANKTIVGHVPIRPLPAPALLNTREHSGCAGNRVGEAQNPGPATHDQPNAAHRRISDAGDSVPSSQESLTRGVQNFPCGTGSPASPATVNNEEI